MLHFPHSFEPKRVGVTMNKDLLNITEFCELTNCGRTKVYEMIGKGEVRAVKVGSKTLIPRAEVQRWIDTLKQYPVSKNA